MSGETSDFQAHRIGPNVNGGECRHGGREIVYRLKAGVLRKISTDGPDWAAVQSIK